MMINAIKTTMIIGMAINLIAILARPMVRDINLMI